MDERKAEVEAETKAPVTEAPVTEPVKSCDSPIVLRVFPRRTKWTPCDELTAVGDPGLFRPQADEVHISVTFTWDVKRAKDLQGAWGYYYKIVKIGGPAFGSPCDDFTPGKYIKRGVTFTSRGCDGKCPWCLVPEREGKLRTLPVVPGHIIQDNNFLACPKAHRLAVYEMLEKQKERATFAGGLDARLVTNEIADELRDVRIAEVFLAADSKAALKPLQAAVDKLGFLTQRQRRCYVLCGFNGETIAQAKKRLEVVWEIGCLPFAQIYQPPDRWIEYPQQWRDLRRSWTRPAAMFAMHPAECATSPSAECSKSQARAGGA